LSRHRSPVRCVSTAFLARGFEDQSSGRFTLHHHSVRFRPTNHRYGLRPRAMMLSCEHPAFCRVRERPINPSVWVYLPGAPAGCSRYGRSLDNLRSAAASSRVARPTSLPLPPSPLIPSVLDGLHPSRVGYHHSPPVFAWLFCQGTVTQSEALGPTQLIHRRQLRR